jgi:hypothetical protein
MGYCNFELWPPIIQSRISQYSQRSLDSMFCKSCGTEVSKTDRFCPKCGARVSGNTENQQVTTPDHQGRFHRFCISSLVIWTAFWTGLTISVVGSVGKEGEGSVGALIGLAVGLGFYAFLWFLPSLVLAVAAIATRPSNRVAWPSGTKWTTGLLAAFLLFVPQLPHTLSSPSKAKSNGGVSVDGEHVPTWSAVEEKSEMDGSSTVTLSLDAENKIQGWLDSRKPLLVIRCAEKKTDVYVAAGMPANPEYGRYNTYGVRIRVDDSTPISQRWTQSTDSRALFSPSPKELAKLLAKSKQLIFEFTPFQSSPATARFNVQGLDGVLEKVAVPCGWGKAQEAALEKERMAKDEDRKAHEQEHLKQWRLHIDVKAINYNSVTLHASADGAPESEIELLGVAGSDSKHIDGNNEVKIEIEWPNEPSMLTVTVNGKLWPVGNWTTTKGTDSYDGNPLGTKYFAHISAQP